MINTIETTGHVIGLRIADVVEKKDIQKIEEVFAEKLKGTQKHCLLIDMTKWSDMTGDAIAEDVPFELGMISKLDRFEKFAIVSDKQFVSAIVKFLLRLVPKVNVKVFKGTDYKSALAFVSDSSEAR